MCLERIPAGDSAAGATLSLYWFSLVPELRKDPITDQWVIISPDKARRPGDFLREPVVPKLNPHECPYCAGNEATTPREVFACRQNSSANQPGWSVRVIPHKFPVLGIEGNLEREGEGLFDMMKGVGAHEVIIESPDHVLSMADLPRKSIEQVLGAFRSRIHDLRNDRRLKYILLFKNHGDAAGAGLEHTHSQLIALPVVPKRVQEELRGAKKYYKAKERCIFCDMLRQEARAAIRVVIETERFVVLQPYASRFPFETWILPKQHRSHFEGIDAVHLENLAEVLKSTLERIDRALERPAYSFSIHTAPLQDEECRYFHWHIEIIPKVTRVAGFEWGTGFHINPTPPEESAKFLRDAGRDPIRP